MESMTGTPAAFLSNIEHMLHQSSSYAAMTVDGVDNAYRN